MNYYTILGVEKTASPEQIKAAYRKLASKNHPDKGGDTVRFQEIQTAYDVLSDASKRQAYDNPMTQGPQNFNFNFGGAQGDLNDIFNQFFGGRNPFANMRSHPQRNRDIRSDIVVQLVDTLSEQRKTFQITTEQGIVLNSDLVIPRGITSGTTIKYPGLGENANTNLPRGDLYLTVNVQRNPNFQVSGLDLMTSLTIDCFQAILGCEQTIAGLDGKIFTIQTPSAAQNGMKLKLSGEGLYAFQQDVKGNLYVNINVKIPTNLTSEQLELIKKLQTTGK
jgi:curved DNA-binding protein